MIFLTCDAFGVLPPVSKLTPAQAMYHFISGYTAKVAGTEMGVTEPQATFSPCFGGPFLVWHPAKYAELLAAKMQQHKANAWLVNTGWSGGALRRRLADEAQADAGDHRRDSQRRAGHRPRRRSDPVFGFAVPTACPGVPAEILMPRNTWSDKASYDATARSWPGCSATTSRSTPTAPAPKCAPPDRPPSSARPSHRRRSMMKFMVSSGSSRAARTRLIEAFELRGPNRNPGVTFRKALDRQPIGGDFRTRRKRGRSSSSNRRCQSWAQFGEYQITPVIDHRTVLERPCGEQDSMSKNKARNDDDDEAKLKSFEGKDYERELKKLHVELVKLQEWVKHKG